MNSGGFRRLDCGDLFVRVRRLVYLAIGSRSETRSYAWCVWGDVGLCH
jgi:hypothetical protein